jgi:hypothetical protein
MGKTEIKQIKGKLTRLKTKWAHEAIAMEGLRQRCIRQGDDEGANEYARASMLCSDFLRDLAKLREEMEDER